MSPLSGVIEKLKVFIEFNEIPEAIECLTKQSDPEKINHHLIELTRKKLNKILLSEQFKTTSKKGLLLKDVVYDALIALAKIFPNNDEDPISLESIDEPYKIFISTGHQFDIRSLVLYYHTKPNRAFYNPFTNLPLSEQDKKHVLLFATQAVTRIGTNPLISSQMPIEEGRSANAYRSSRVDHSFFRPNRGNLTTTPDNSVANHFFSRIIQASIMHAHNSTLSYLSLQLVLSTVLYSLDAKQFSESVWGAHAFNLHPSTYFLLSMYEHAEFSGNALNLVLLIMFTIKFFQNDQLREIVRKASLDPIKYGQIATISIFTIATLGIAWGATEIDPSLTKNLVGNHSFLIQLIAKLALCISHSTVTRGVLATSFSCLIKTLENIAEIDENSQRPNVS